MNSRGKVTMHRAAARCTLEGRPFDVLSVVGFFGVFVFFVVFGIAGAFWQDWSGEFSLLEQKHTKWR
jgi:hypothetical protein